MRSEHPVWVWALSGTMPVLAAIASFLLVGATTSDLRWVVVAGVAVTVGGLVWLPTRSYMHRTAAYGVSAALPLITSDGVRVLDDAGSMLAVVAGLGVLWFVQTARGADQRILLVEQFRGVAAFVVYLTVLARLGDFEVVGVWAPSARFLVAALAAFSAEALMALLLSLFRITGNLSHRARRSANDLDAFLATTGTGALFALTFDRIGWWALALALVIYAFTHTAFEGFKEAKITYDQTLVALAQIAEVAGHSARGHAAQTAELARALALARGAGPSETEKIERVGLLHEVGRVTLNEPGVIRRGYTDGDIARWGAEIIRQSEPLESVAAAVERLRDPYRSPGGLADPGLPLAARIVNAACRYVRSTTEEEASPLEALDQLHRQSLDDVDSEIVDLLRRVLERKGALASVRS